MSERNNGLPIGRRIDIVDVIKRTLQNKFVTILSIAEENSIKFQAQIQGGPTLILEPDPTKGWVSTHPDKELVRLIGDLVESASD